MDAKGNDGHSEALATGVPGEARAFLTAVGQSNVQVLCLTK